MADLSITRRDHGKTYKLPTTVSHVIVLTPLKGYLLEVEGEHFHVDSAVLLPECKIKPDRDRITGPVILAACLQYVKDHPTRKVLIAGHTDASGTAAHNLTLSHKRAKSILHALMGERDGWAALVDSQHNVEDYQLILKWVTREYLWPCDPGDVDNVLGPDTKRAVRRFQERYNHDFDGKLTVDGIVGTQTWGAIFNVYMYMLASLLDTDAAGLADLRSKVQFLGPKTVGCGQEFPILEEDGSKYRSDEDRRAEILFFDPGQEPKLDCHPGAGACQPLLCETYNPKMYKLEHIPVPPLRPAKYLDIETVDAYLVRSPNIALKLLSQDGNPDVSLTTDTNGYARKRVKEGKYKITLQDGSPTYYFKDGGKASDDRVVDGKGSLTEAVVDTHNYLPSITRVVVSLNATPEQREERRALAKVYVRSKDGGAVDVRGTATANKDEEGALVLRTRQNCVDNLIVAAGWTDKGQQVNLKGLVKDVLHGWLQDYFPYNLTRGYYVLLITSATGKVTLMNQSGDIEATFDLVSGIQLDGRFGAYAMFEDAGDLLFRDMTTETEVIDPGTGSEIDIHQILTDPDRFDDVVNRHGNQLMIVYYSPTAGQLATAAEHGGTGRLEDYVADSGVNGDIHNRNLATVRNIAAVYNSHIRYYEDQVDKIVAELRQEQQPGIAPDDMEEEFKKRLRVLGPPMTPFEMPIPAGATLSQIEDILSAYDVDEVSPWRKIAQQLDGFAHVKSAGLPFLRIKPKWGSLELTKELSESQKKLRPKVAWGLGHVPAGVEIEGNIELQRVDGEIRVLRKVETKWVISVGLGETTEHYLGKIANGPPGWKQKVSAALKKALPVEVEVKGKLEPAHEGSLNIEIGEAEEATLKVAEVFEVEASADGNLKLTLLPFPEAPVEVISEANPENGEMAAGIKITGETMARALEKSADRFKGNLKDPAYLERWPGVKHFLEKHEGGIDGAFERVAFVLKQCEIEVEVGFVGLAQDALLPMTSNSPGLFQQRDLDVLFAPKMVWNMLNLDEQTSLANLGWTCQSWDEKYERPKLIPSHSKKDPSAAERIAVIHLGFRNYARYSAAVNRYCGGGGEGGKGGEDGGAGGGGEADSGRSEKKME